MGAYVEGPLLLQDITKVHEALADRPRVLGVMSMIEPSSRRVLRRMLRVQISDIGELL